MFTGENKNPLMLYLVFFFNYLLDFCIISHINFLLHNLEIRIRMRGKISDETTRNDLIFEILCHFLRFNAY